MYDFCHVVTLIITMEYFTLNELCHSNTAQHYGITNKPDAQAVRNLNALVDHVLDPLRRQFGKPIYVNSGYRCPQLNKLVGGAVSSQHMRGEAADIRAQDMAALTNLVIEMRRKGRLLADQIILEKIRVIDGKHVPLWIHISFVTRRENRNQLLIK